MPIPRSLNLCWACCNSTSCILQYGHQSAERKNKSTVPFFPATVLFVCSLPNWSRALKGGAGSPSPGPAFSLGTAWGKFSSPDGCFEAKRREEVQKKVL